MVSFTFRRRHHAENITPDRVSSSVSGDSDMGAMDALNALKHFEMMHHLDPNLPLEELCEVDAALNGANAEKGVEIEQILIEDNSPYPEVTYPARPHLIPVIDPALFKASRLLTRCLHQRSAHRCAISTSSYP